MKIDSINIKNIKKYSNIEYSFTNGVQLILGPNGSGKSTIVESIGWVLFDYLDYKLSDWVKWGEESGSVTVNLSDDKVFVVHRDTDGNYTLTSNGSVLATGVKDVQRYIRKFFNITDDASKVFKDVIGVSQDIMSAQFSMTPSYKKKIFDPLLGIDKFDKMWNQLKPIESLLEKEIESVNVETATVGGFLSAENETVSDFKATKEKYDRSVEEKSKLKLIFQELDRQLQNMVEKKKSYDRVISINNEINLSRARLNDIIERQKTLDSFKKEKTILENDANLQKKTRDKLLEIKEAERNLSRLTNEHKKLTSEYEILKETIEYAEQQYKDNFEMLDREASSFKSLEIEFKKIEGERIKLETEIAVIEKQLVMAKEGKCPITGEPCPANILSTVIDKKNKADEFMENVFYKDYMDIKSKVGQTKNAVISLDNLIKMKDNANRELKRIAVVVDSINSIVSDIDKCNNIICNKSSIEEINKKLGNSLDRYNELCILVKNEDNGFMKKQIEQKINDLEDEKVILEPSSSSFVVDDFEKLKAEHNKIKTLFESISKEILELQETMDKLKLRLDVIKTKKDSLQGIMDRRTALVGKIELIKATREKLREIPPEIAKSLLVAINETSNRYYNEIAGASTLMIDSEYNVFLSDHKGTRGFKNLSGGEKMTVSVAIRLAFLHEITDIKFMALDEPTASVDAERRQLLSDIISNVKGLDQLFIVSHDSVFISQADNIIEVIP